LTIHVRGLVFFTGFEGMFFVLGVANGDGRGGLGAVGVAFIWVEAAVFGLGIAVGV